jgi:GH15 family glucan-1,4-alpha-glucosidase
MLATCARIQERLGRNGLIYRYGAETADGLPPGEGAFGICSFWAVECRAREGDLAGATATFERLLGYANDVGLFGEEIDPESGAALGNFPQAFTHVGLINAALTLAECGARFRRQASSEVSRPLIPSDLPHPLTPSPSALREGELVDEVVDKERRQ